MSLTADDQLREAMQKQEVDAAPEASPSPSPIPDQSRRGDGSAFTHAQRPGAGHSPSPGRVQRAAEMAVVQALIAHVNHAVQPGELPPIAEAIVARGQSSFLCPIPPSPAHSRLLWSGTARTGVGNCRVPA